MSRLRSNLASKSVALLVLLSVCLLRVPAARGQAQTTPIALERNKPIERSIAAAETQSYTLTLTAGQYAYFVTDQRGVDVVVSVFAPDGTKLVRVDMPNGNSGPEPVSLIAGATGVYRVDVLSTSPKLPGRYEVKLADVHAATETDRKRIAAQNLFTEAKALRYARTKESYQQAVEKYAAALTIWRVAGDKLMEAFTLHEEGLIYGDIGLYQQAIDAYSRAAVIFKELKLPSSEAAVTINIGWVFGELGDTQNRLAMYERASEIYRTAGEISPVLISNFASTYAQLGEYQRALDMHLQLLELRLPLKEPLGIGITLRNIGDCYHRLGDKQKALDFYTRSLEYMQLAGDHFYTASTLSDLGLIYESLGQKEKALDYLNQTLELQQKINDRKGVAITMFYLARVQRDLGNTGEARKLIEEALERVEKLRTQVASQQLRATFFAWVQQYRELYIDLLMRLHKENPSQLLEVAAFNASETGRARSLLELLSEANAEIHHGVRFPSFWNANAVWNRRLRRKRKRRHVC